MTEGSSPQTVSARRHEGRGGARSSTSAARRRRSRLGSVASPSTAVVPSTPTPTAHAVSHGPPHPDANRAPRETRASTSWIPRPAHPDVVTRSHRWRSTHAFLPDHQPAAHHHPTTSASASYASTTSWRSPATSPTRRSTEEALLMARRLPPSSWSHARASAARSLRLAAGVAGPHHPGRAEPIGAHAVRLGEERRLERLADLATVAERVEHALGIADVGSVVAHHHPLHRPEVVSVGSSDAIRRSSPNVRAAWMMKSACSGGGASPGTSFMSAASARRRRSPGSG